VRRPQCACRRSLRAAQCRLRSHGCLLRREDALRLGLHSRQPALRLCQLPLSLLQLAQSAGGGGAGGHPPRGSFREGRLQGRLLQERRHGAGDVAVAAVRVGRVGSQAGWRARGRRVGVEAALAVGAWEPMMDCSQGGSRARLPTASPPAASCRAASNVQQLLHGVGVAGAIFGCGRRQLWLLPGGADGKASHHALRLVRSQLLCPLRSQGACGGLSPQRCNGSPSLGLGHERSLSLSPFERGRGRPPPMAVDPPTDVDGGAATASPTRSRGGGDSRRMQGRCRRA